MPLVHRRLRVPARLIAVTVAAVLAVVLLPAEPAPAAAGRKVSKAFFGMHDSKSESWPKTRVGALRLWDSGVSWRGIETVPGAYDFARLDNLVAVARANKAEITLTLGQTPTFRVTGTVRPGCNTAPKNPLCSRYGRGATSMPNLTAWSTYVRTVAERYRGRIQALQVWNEGNVPGFWAGSPSQLARLTATAKAAVNAVNKKFKTHMKLVAPSFVARSNTGFTDKYFKSKTGGKAVSKYVDVVAFSLYPSAAGRPEDSMKLLKSVKAMLAKRKVKKPIWNTEINYGLAAGGTGKKPPKISSKRQAAYVVRTYLLNANAHVDRVFWYSWNLRSIGNTILTSGSSDTPTLAGKAFGLTQSWLAGTKLKSCSTISSGAYVCTLKYKGGVKRVYWHPTRGVRITMPSTATYSISLTGQKKKLKGGSTMKVGYRPVLVRSKR
jgi:polysaccharide biosynthesis protein PslG